MAGFNEEDRKNLGKIASNFSKTEPIKMPKNVDSGEEIAYSTTDLILGIAAVGMFGEDFKKIDHTNINSVLNQKSFLANLAKNSDDFKTNFADILQNGKSSIRATIVSMPEIKLPKEFIDNQRNSEIAQIILSINNANNLSELNKSLEDLSKITNDSKHILSSIQIVEKLFKIINDLPSINKSINVDQNIEVINNVAKTLSAINSNDDLSNLNKLDEHLDGITKLINYLNNDKLIGKITEVNIKLTNNADKLKVDNINKFLKAFNDITNGVNISDGAKNIGDILNSVFNLLKFDTKINEEALNELAYIVDKNGPIDDIIRNVGKLGNDAINQDAVRGIKNTQAFIDSLKTLTEITLREKIRIISNILFFKHYVNKALPSLIISIEKSFKGIILNNRNATLDNLSKYFDALKDITIFSFKDKIKIISSMLFMRKYLVEQLGKLIGDIEKNFKGKSIDNKIEQIFDFFGKLSKMNISADFDKQKESLESIENFLFGSKLAGRIGFVRTFDSIVGNASVLGIVSRLQNEEIDLDAATKSFKNLQEILANIKRGLSYFNISEKEIENKSDALDLFNDDIIGNIIKLEKKKDKVNGGLLVLKSFTTSIKEIFRTKTLGEILSKLDTNKAERQAFKFSLFITQFVRILVYLSKRNEKITEGMEVLKSFVNLISETFTKNTFAEILNKLDTNGAEINIIKLKIFGINLIDVMTYLSENKEDLSSGLTVLNDFINEILSINTDQSLAEKLENLDVKEASLYLIRLKIFSTNLIDLSTFLADNNEKITSGINVLNSFAKSINEQFKRESLDKTFAKIAVSQETLDKLELTEKALKNIEKVGKLFVVIEKLNLTKKSLDNINKISKRLKAIVDSFNDIDEKTLKNINNLIKSIFKVIIGAALILVVGSMLMAFVDWENLAKFASGMMLMTALIGGLLFAIHKLKIDEKKVNNITLIFKEIGKLLLLSSIMLFAGSIIVGNIKLESIAKYLGGLSIMVLLIGGLIMVIDKSNLTKAKVDNATKLLITTGALLLAASVALLAISYASKKFSWKTLLGIALFGVLTIAYIGMVFGVVWLLSKFKKVFDTGKVLPQLMQMSLIVLLLSTSLALVSVAATVASPAHILAFGGMLALLIGAITIPLIFVKSPLFKMSFSAVKSLGALILLVTVSLMLGAFVVQAVPVPVVLAFGALLSLLIVSLTLPLLALSITGKAAIKGGKDLGQIILYATIGLGLGAALMMIPGMKEKIEEFSGVYNKFLFKLLLAVGICSFLSKHGLEDIKEVSKIIKTSTFMLLLGGALFLLFPKLKEAVMEFATTLGLFIGGIVVAIGFAGLLGRKAIKHMWQVSLLIIVASGSLLLAAHVLKNDPKAIPNILTFTGALLLLVGGLVFIAKIAKITRLWKGLLSIGVITLMIFGIAYIFKYISENLLQYDLGKLWGFTASMLGIIVMFLVAAGLIGFIAQFTCPLILIGIGAIGIAGLLLWGIGYIFNYICENLLQYDIGRIWAITGSMLGIMAMILLGAGIIGAIGIIAFPFLIIGGIVLVLSGVLLWGMAWLFGQVLEIDKKYDFIGNGGKNYENSKICIIIDTLFDATEHVLDRLYNLQIGQDSGIMSFIKSIPIVGGVARFVGGVADAIALFPNLAVAAAGILATAGICENLATLILYMKLVGNNPEKEIDKAADMIEAILGIYNDPRILKQIEAAEDHKNLLEGMSEMAKAMAKVIYDVSLGIKYYSELRIEEIGPNGEPTGNYREFTNDDFKNAATNIATIITCVGGSIMGLFGIGPFAKEMTPGQQEIAEEMLKTARSGLFGSKTKFQLVMEGAEKLGDIIKKISEGVMQWSKLPDDFDAELAAQNIETIITTVGGAILSLIKDGPTSTEITVSDKEFKMSVVNELLQTSGGGFLGLGSKKTKFQLVMEGAEKLGDIIKKIAEGVMEWSKIPPEIFSKEGATSAQDNIASIITTVGGAIMKLYTGEGLHGIKAETAKEMFEGGPWYNRSNTKFKQVLDSVGKLGEMIANIMYGVQAYANLRIPIKWNEEGQPVDFKPMDNNDFKNAVDNIELLVLTLGRAVTSVANSSEFEKVFSGYNTEKVSQAILNVSGALGPIANALYMYATGKFPIYEYQDGKLVTKRWFDVNKHGGIYDVALEAEENVRELIFGLAGALYDVWNDDDLEFLYDDADEVNLLTDSLVKVSTTLGTFFEKIGKIIEGKLTSAQVTLYIAQPFTEFIKHTLYSKDKNDPKYRLADEHRGYDTLKIYIEAIDMLLAGVSKTINGLKDIISISTEIKPNLPIIFDVFNGYVQLYDKMEAFAATYSEENDIAFTKNNTNIQSIIDIIQNVKEEYEVRFNVLKEGISGLAVVIAGIKSNKNFGDHAKTLKSYVENTNKLSLPKIKSLTNLVNAINEFGDKFGNIDDFTNAIVEKLTESLDHLSGKLNEAKETIETTEKLHNKRKQLIEESVRNITELMDKELTVNIKEEQPDYTPIGGSPSDESVDGEKGVPSQEGTKPTGSEGVLGTAKDVLTDASNENDKNNSRNTDRSRQTNVTPQQQLYNPRPESSKFIQLDAGIIGQKIADAIREHLQQQ